MIRCQRFRNDGHSSIPLDQLQVVKGPQGTRLRFHSLFLFFRNIICRRLDSIDENITFPDSLERGRPVTVRRIITKCGCRGNPIIPTGIFGPGSFITGFTHRNRSPSYRIATIIIKHSGIPEPHLLSKVSSMVIRRHSQVHRSSQEVINLQKHMMSITVFMSIFVSANNSIIIYSKVKHLNHIIKPCKPNGSITPSAQVIDFISPVNRFCRQKKTYFSAMTALAVFPQGIRVNI